MAAILYRSQCVNEEYQIMNVPTHVNKPRHGEQCRVCTYENVHILQTIRK